MKKVLKWIGIALAGLIGLLILAVVAVYIISSSRINKTYDIQVESVNIPTDEEALEWGQHIAQTRGCNECHTGNFAGGAFIEDPALANLYASNLTAGQGGVGSTYSDTDWVRAIRHGVGPDGKPLLFMPSQEFYYLSDEDLGALIAYLKTLPPVDHQVTEDSVGPLGRVLLLAGQLPLLPVEMIDHDGPRPSAPPVGVTVAYGEYLAVGCQGCHGADYAGGPIPGAPPDAPVSLNLTPGGELQNWTEEDFIQTLRTGITPDGHELDNEWMPWPIVGQMTDEELQAIWLFLQSLAPVNVSL
jgi:mono/diheme cytochrome c family protein